MSCPQCAKELEVPWESPAPRGPTAPARRPASREGRRRPMIPQERKGATGVIVAVVAVIALLAVVIGYAAERNRREAARGEACATCKGSGKQQCPGCQGARTERCGNAECKGGKIVNFRGEEETCLTCNGSSSMACRTCTGLGHLGCPPCSGRGRLPAK